MRIGICNKVEGVEGPDEEEEKGGKQSGDGDGKSRVGEVEMSGKELFGDGDAKKGSLRTGSVGGR